MSPGPVVSRAAKVAAVVSSISLVALYISHRTGGQTTPTPALPGSKGWVVQLHATTGPSTAPVAATTQQHFIYSSKSAPVFNPPQAIGGSKFAPVFRPADTTVVFPQADALTLQSTAAATTRSAAGTQPVGKP